MYCLYVSACVPKKHLSMSKVNLIWTRAIRPVIAQSAQFGEIAFSQIHFNNITSDALFLRRPFCYAQ